MTTTIGATEALRRLQEGNRRFVEGRSRQERRFGKPDSENYLDRQEPLAIILGCSDARVPAEIVFDQGLGDLFVIRVAGNIVAPSQLESIEFAASRFGTRLVVVLGHSHCGAVMATIDELERPPEERSRSLRSIVDRVRPAVEPLVTSGVRGGRDALVAQAVQANIRASVAQLCRGSEGMQELIREGGLRVVGAEYSLETGAVSFLD